MLDQSKRVFAELTLRKTLYCHHRHAVCAKTYRLEQAVQCVRLMGWPRDQNQCVLVPVLLHVNIVERHANRPPLAKRLIEDSSRSTCKQLVGKILSNTLGELNLLIGIGSPKRDGRIFFE